LPCGEAPKSDPGVTPAIMLPAVKVESVFRNERRVNEFIFVLSRLRTGFYDAGRPAQSLSASEFVTRARCFLTYT
jgi:hypothetical protein